MSPRKKRTVKGKNKEMTQTEEGAIKSSLNQKLCFFKRNRAPSQSLHMFINNQKFISW
ncbi:hypothetical protein Bca4012_044010 [Brassica carinata]|uniref:BnaC09g53070D protein n=4 Tax=Brassica TaxID=3705 RepID=A0A078JTK9_BRANA|nr:hypothetical protein HID58_087074 [Brassica napus]CAF1748406.1 unnamed protein product [Brassica napus]CDY63941.1 BnaC09g53070D [Brassica napus]CDY70169.1 BnaCnng67030D [Brassica napus]VDD31275.1 unnamed protein product [Brassica oleracea]